MKKTIAMLLAGGQGSRLNILASHRAKPAVPFAGNYRIIDITLSNIMHSDIDNVGILTQYRPGSLIEHIRTGESWDLYGKKRGAVILPPYQGEDDSSWYKGTADAVYQNLSYIQKMDGSDKVLILSADHIYKMNYKKLIKYHKKKDADVTVVAMEVPFEDASRFGTIFVDNDNRIIEFDEKPKNPKSNLASLGIYLFNKDILIHELKKDAVKDGSTHDFGRDILPNLLNKKLYIYKFDGYWKDVGTIEEYWATNMELLKRKSPINFDDWKVTTNFQRSIIADRNPALINHSANVKKSFICEGCIIKGIVKNSILSPGVLIEKDAVIENSIVFHDTIIKQGAVVNRAIIDKNVVVDEKAIVGFGKMPGKPNSLYPTHLYSGITIIGKNAKIPQNIKLGRNCIVNPDVGYSSFALKEYQDGEVIF